MFPVAVGMAFAIDRAFEVELDGLDDDELVAMLVELHRQHDRLAAAVVRLVGDLDRRRVWERQGYRNAATWVSRRCRVPPLQARAEVRLARRLPAMPLTRAAFEGGDIGLAHALRLAGMASPRRAEAFAEAEATLVERARTLEWPEFHRLTAR